MNILFSTTARLSIPSAQRTHISEIVNNLAELDNKVHLIALDKGNLELHENVVFHRIGPRTNKRFMSFICARARAIYTSILISRILAKESIDVTYERHNPHDYATRKSHRGGIPAVVEVNGIVSLPARFSKDQKTAKKIEISELTNLQFATKIIAVTEGIRDYYVSLGVSREKIVVIPNGVNADIFRPLNKSWCRKELGLGNSPLITFVGQFRPNQGLEYAIKAMPYVLDFFPDAKLMLVGDAGEYEGYKFKPAIQDLKLMSKELGVERSIVFTGRVSHEEVSLFINASDVCVSPEANDVYNRVTGGCSIKIFEYMACGKPVIVGNLRGNAEIVNSANSGFVVDTVNSEEFAGKILLLLTNEALQNKLGDNGRRTVKLKYTWKAITKRLTKVFDEARAAFVERANMCEKHPMQKVMLELKKRNINLSSAYALEVFGREGDWHTKDYASYVGDLEVWEINPKFLDGLKRNLPDAKIKITDSFKEVKITPNKYDIIVIDNPQSIYGENDEYCEHFELFPYTFRIANNPCVIILNVNVEPYNFHEGLPGWERRKTFYQTVHPEKLSLEFVNKHYEDICLQNGLEMKWSFFQRRNDFLYYFVFKIEKSAKVALPAYTCHQKR